MVVDTACDWIKPIYLTGHHIYVTDRQTKKDILTLNKELQANCCFNLKKVKIPIKYGSKIRY
ncbi:TPA: hypothetical protein ACNFPT_004193 [Enterobacter ludwigii]